MHVPPCSHSGHLLHNDNILASNRTYLLIKGDTSNLAPLDRHTRNRARQQARLRVPRKHVDLAVPLGPDSD